MQDVHNDLMDQTNNKFKDFTDTAQKWSHYSLMTHKGSLLKKAMDISIALVEYEEELKDQKA